jgi:hypothetical protein
VDRSREVGFDLEVAVEDGVHEGLAEGDGDLDEAGLVAQAHALEVVLELADEGRDRGDVVGDHEARFGLDEALEDELLLLVGLRDLEHFEDGLGELAGEVLLGDVAGGALLQGLDGDLFAAVRGHQDDRERWVVLADGLDELKAVHLGHLEIGDDDVGDVLRDRRQGFAAVLRVDRVQADVFFEEAAGQAPVHRGVIDDEDFGHRRTLEVVELV